MKKKMICGAAMLLFGLAAVANPPAPTGTPIDEASNNYTGTYLQPQSAEGPLAPATLLLLGLAGGFAGVKMYQNNKQKKEDEI